MTSDSHSWHTIRFPDRWTPFADVENETGNRGSFMDVDYAGVSGELHVCGITSDGRLWHTIRHPNRWEPFGDVKGEAGDRRSFKTVSVDGPVIS